jgi:hypothetical protein
VRSTTTVRSYLSGDSSQDVRLRGHSHLLKPSSCHKAPHSGPAAATPPPRPKLRGWSGAECLPRAECRGVPSCGRLKRRGGGVPESGVCGRSAYGCGRSAARPSAGPREARGRSAYKRGLRAECLQLRAECFLRAECGAVPSAGPPRGEGAECLQARQVCGRSASSFGWSASRGRSAAECRGRGLDR